MVHAADQKAALKLKKGEAHLALMCDILVPEGPIPRRRSGSVGKSAQRPQRATSSLGYAFRRRSSTCSYFLAGPSSEFAD